MREPTFAKWQRLQADEAREQEAADGEWNYIYLLCDPGDGRARYVGVTNSPARRFFEHLNKGSRAVTAWVRECARNGTAPSMLIVEILPYREQYKGLERKWLNRLTGDAVEPEQRPLNHYPRYSGRGKK